MKANKIGGKFCLWKEERNSCESRDEYTGVSENSKWKSEDISWTVRWPELGRKQDSSSPGKTETPGLLGGEPHNPKGAVTWMNKRACGMTG